MRMPVVMLMVVMLMVFMLMVFMLMVVTMMVIMRVVVMVPVSMVVIMPMIVSMIVAVLVAVLVPQVVLQIVFIVGLSRCLGGTSAGAAGFCLGRFLIGRVSLGGLRALHLVPGQGSGFRFTLVMPAAMRVVVAMMMPMAVFVVVLVVVLMRMFMMVPMFMVVAMVMSVVMSASASMFAQTLVVELVRHLQPLLIQQRQRARTVAGCGAGSLDFLCRHAFSQQGQALVEITMANAVDHQAGAGRCQRQCQSKLNQQVGRIAHQLFGLLGKHHQLGRVRQVETHRYMTGRHMLEPVGVSRGRHGLQPNANASASSRGALRRLTACSPVRGLQQQAAGGRQGQQGLENAC